MSSTNRGEDLSSPDSHEGGNIIVSGGGQMSTAVDLQFSQPTTVSLDAQKLFQRKILFWVTLVVCSTLFCAFFVSFFFCHFLRVLIIQQPYAISLAMALLLIPSALLWGLIRAVYRMPTESLPQCSEMVKEVSKVIPQSSM